MGDLVLSNARVLDGRGGIAERATVRVSDGRVAEVLPGYVESFEIDEETQESIPMRRRGTVEEIAKTAAFLLSDDAGYITGQNIRVDGGLTRSV